MAERLFTNTTGAYGYEPEVDDTFPHTFGEFTVAAEQAVVAHRVVAVVDTNAGIGTATSKTGFTATLGVSLDTVTWEAGRPQIAKVVTSGICVVDAGGTVTEGSPVVATTAGKVTNLTGFSAGDAIVGIALASGTNGSKVIVKVDPFVTLLGD